ncbi:DUF5681 domain-containing protein [Defluviimonas sp. SAOS-178_SWC]|uniref:DUF5681 domain-containing protein n=1 Tax=Defluviimonas sp. SAOS-178_SWC TaxID=3121287 RepID=UPI00322152C5
MSGRGKDRQSRALVARPGYEVGFGKPPAATRFKPGQSGNPRGRPKGAKNKRPGLHEERMKDIILDEAYRTITVRDGDRNITVPMAQAIMRSLAVNAAKGQHRAQRLFAELLASVETSNKMLNDELLNSAMDYKIAWERELDRRDRLGITDLPDPLPHPDHVVIDMNRGTTRIMGPVTRAEEAELKKWRERRDDFAEELSWIVEQLESEENEQVRKALEDDADQTRKVLEIIDTALAHVPAPGSTRLLGRNG